MGQSPDHVHSAGRHFERELVAEGRAQRSGERVASLGVKPPHPLQCRAKWPSIMKSATTIWSVVFLSPALPIWIAWSPSAGGVIASPGARRDDQMVVATPARRLRANLEL